MPTDRPATYDVRDDRHRAADQRADGRPGRPAGRARARRGKAVAMTGAAGRPVRVVHLRRAEYDDPARRAIWQRLGYATLGPVEGHDPYVRCPHCSTDEPCPQQGQARQAGHRPAAHRAAR